MLDAGILNVVRLNVIMPNVMAPSLYQFPIFCLDSTDSNTCRIIAIAIAIAIATAIATAILIQKTNVKYNNVCREIG